MTCKWCGSIKLQLSSFLYSITISVWHGSIYSHWTTAMFSAAILSMLPRRSHLGSIQSHYQLQERGPLRTCWQHSKLQVAHHMWQCASNVCSSQNGAVPVFRWADENLDLRVVWLFVYPFCFSFWQRLGCFMPTFGRLSANFRQSLL